MGMIIHPSFTMLCEAEVTHGKTIQFRFDMLPQHVQNRVKEECKKQGMSDKEIELALSNRGGINDELVPDPVDFSSDKDNDNMPTKFSIHGNDAIDGIIMHELETYDRAMDEAILKSDDIVKSYNALIDAKFEEAKKYAEKYIELKSNADPEDKKAQADVKKFTAAVAHKGITLPTAIYGDLISDGNELKEMLGVTDSEIKKIVCEAAYQPSDDPEQIKKIVNARIKYNDAVIASFKAMLQVNYNILGLTKDEALSLSAKLSSPKQSQSHKAIKDVKSIIVKNSDKYKIGKASYDFRPLGLGCIFMTEEDVGPIGDTVKLDRMIQMLTQYDAVVVGHGGSYSDEYKRYISKMITDYEEREVNYRKETKEKTKEVRKELEEALDALVEVDPEYKALRAECDKIKEEAFSSFFTSEECKIYDKMVDDLNKENLPYDEWKKRYDEIIKARDKAYDVYKKHTDEAFKKYRKLSDDLYDFARNRKNELRDKDIPEVAEFKKKFDAIEKEIRKDEYTIHKKEMQDAQRMYDKLYKRGNIKWVIQPVKTLHGGPYTDVNELVRQLIKEGFKNINLVACNPGGHTLAKDILDAPGVKIHHAEASLMAENVVDPCGDMFIDEAFSSVEASLKETQKHLISICESSHFSINDDQYLNECTMFFTSGEANEVLTEGVLATAWAKLKELISKALGFLVNLFKKIIQLFANIIQKIKNFFKKIFSRDTVSKSFSSKVTSGAIIVESARLNKKQVSSWEELQQLTVASCEKISKKIEELERKQTSNMQQLEKFADQKSKKVNESTNLEMDAIMSLLWS